MDDTFRTREMASSVRTLRLDAASDQRMPDECSITDGPGAVALAVAVSNRTWTAKKL